MDEDEGMDIVITGATGLIGTALTARLRAGRHRVRVVSRHAGGADTIVWDPTDGRLDPDQLEGVDAVIHLAGEPIARRPWTDEQRRRLRDSRIDGTRLLVDTLGALEHPPSVLIGASAVGWYGSRGDELLDESSPPGDDELARLCLDWEAEERRAGEHGIRVVSIRTGIVLDADGGALAKQLPLFRFGLGARAGAGTQWLPWISLRDHIAAIEHLLGSELSGPVNLTGPVPVMNRTFTEAVARHLGRPTFLVLPRLLTRLPFGVGPLVDSLLFSSQRVVPAALLADGFEFRDTALDEALTEVLGR